MFNKMPFVLILIIISVIALNEIIPKNLQCILYAMSLSAKTIIIFLLPIIIFGLLFKATVNLANDATLIIAIIMIGVCCSNFITAFLSHYVGSWIYKLDLSLIIPRESTNLTPTWSFDLPVIIPNSQAMISAIIFGIVIIKFSPPLAYNISAIFEKIVSVILKVFSLLIPLFVTGFIIKLQSDGVVTTIIKDYTKVFAVVLLAQIFYLSILYLIANKFNIKMFVSNIINMIPAAILGFSTMSSAASMPLTVSGVERNAKDKNLIKSIIPLTVNIHLIGDCLAIPIFAYAILKNYNMPQPDLISYTIFTLYFVLAKFSVAAVPGGGIIVMLPILNAHLGFNAEMMSLITALYILFDPMITCVNILGNGAFAKIIDQIRYKIIPDKNTKLI